MNDESMQRPWKTFSMAVRGERHRQMGMLCQDRVFAGEAGERQVILLADGIFQNNIGILGIEQVLEEAGETCLRFKGSLIRDHALLKADLVNSFIRVIERVAAEYGEERHTFASTLLLVCLDRMEGSFFTAQLGNGGILIRRKGGEDYDKIPCLHALLAGEKTFVTTSPDPSSCMEIRYDRIGDIREFLLYSDGYDTIAARKDSMVRLAVLSREMNLHVRGLDDRSLIGIYRDEPSGHEAGSETGRRHRDDE